MQNAFCKTPLWEASLELAAVAMGRSPADMVIRDARLVNVCTREIMEHTDVAIAQGRVALVGDASHCIGARTAVIDARGAIIAPGFLDGHIHTESSMMTVGEYARAVVPHGTVGIYADPHEICNVFGVRGVELIIEDALRTPLKTMITVPSCVPAVPGFEDAGASVTSADVREMMAWERVVGLGEMMNFPGVFMGDAEVHAKIGETLKAGKCPTGHFSMPDGGKLLQAYAASGVRCCHESTNARDALAKMRLGVYAMLREGSAWHDLRETASAVTEGLADSRFAVLISDDTHPDTLIENGHMDHILRLAVKEGIDPLTALQMVTINCAQCFGMDGELGSIAPGKCADIVFLEGELAEFNVAKVIIDGELVAEDGRLIKQIGDYSYPAWARESMNLPPVTAQSFRIATPIENGSVKARVIEALPGRVGNIERILALVARDGQVQADAARDILKAFVFERHHGTGTFGYGFITGFGIRRGAVAQTVAHDAHNLLVAGGSDEDMALAANTLIGCGGGLCAVADGEVLALVPLPVAGLISDLGAENLSAQIKALEAAWEALGCGVSSPFMTLALASLACLPELRVTNRGLVDCRTFEMTELFVTEQ